MRISEIVRGMQPRRYTTSQAARMIGRSEDTVKRWRDEGVFRPAERRDFGDLQVWLYTSEDIKALRKIARKIHPGPGSVDGIITTKGVVNGRGADTGTSTQGESGATSFRRAAGRPKALAR